MRAVLTILLAMVTAGCAAAPVEVQRPEPCTCAPKRAVHSAPLAVSAPATRGKASLDVLIEAALLKYDLEPLASKSPPQCATLKPELDPVVSAREPDVIEAIREARAGMLVEDATPLEEKAALARAAYERAIETFRAAVEKRLRGVMLDALIAVPAFGKVYETAMVEAFVGKGFTPPGGYNGKFKPTLAFAARFREATSRHLATTIDPLVTACADQAVDVRRGRWIAMFNGKPIAVAP